MRTPTQVRIREVFDYFDGELYRKCANNRLKPVGCESDHAIVVMVDGVLHGVHRLIWIWHNESIPMGMNIHHINDNRFDNRIENLRLANVSDSIRSAGFRKSNTSGLKGAVLNVRNGKWRACIKVNKVQKHLGAFDSKEEAHAAYCAAAVKFHGEFANFGTPRQYVRPQKDAPPSSGQMTQGAGATGRESLETSSNETNSTVALTDNAPTTQALERVAKRQTRAAEGVTGARFCKRCAGHRRSLGGLVLSDAIKRQYWVCQPCCEKFQARSSADSARANAGRAQA